MEIKKNYDNQEKYKGGNEEDDDEDVDDGWTISGAQPKNTKKQNIFEQLRSNVPDDIYNKWDTEQKFLQKLIKEVDEFEWTLDRSKPNLLKYIGGMDISFNGSFKDLACSYFIVMQYPDMKVVHEEHEIVKLDCEYIPGFLAFREAPHLAKLYSNMMAQCPQYKPGVILVDGNGILHQNGCGLASHLGVLLDTPMIGCGQTTFYVDGLARDYINDLYYQSVSKGGDYIKLVGNSGKVWGAALQTINQAPNPLIVSVGHQICIETAIRVVASCCLHDLPHPIQRADEISRNIIQKMSYSQLCSVKPIENQLRFLHLESNQKQVPTNGDSQTSPTQTQEQKEL